MELVREREKTLDRYLVLVKKELAGVKLENAFLPWFRGNVDNKVVTLEEDVGSVIMAVAESA